MVFPENDSEALARHLRSLIEDAQFRTEIADRGYHRVLDLFSGEAVARKIQTLYEEMMEGNDHVVADGAE